MNKQRWRASWLLPNGVPFTFTFDSLPNRMFANIDFKLQLLAINHRVPEHYELEEVPYGFEKNTQGGQNA